MRLIVLGWAAAVLMAATFGVVSAQNAPPDAHIQFSSTSYGLLVGYHQGQGVLEFRGQRHPFQMTGIKVATVGITRINALGQVYRLRDMADFPGRYYTVDGSFTVGQGGGNTLLRNEKGVMIYLQNVQRGAEITLGGGGVDIVLSPSTMPPATVARPALAPSKQPSPASGAARTDERERLRRGLP